MEILAWNSTRKSRVKNSRLLSVIQTAEFSKRVKQYISCQFVHGRIVIAIAILALRHSNGHDIEGRSELEAWWRRNLRSSLSPTHNPTPRMGRGWPNSANSWPQFLYTGRVQKRIHRRWLRFSPAVAPNDLRFLNNCVGLLHILCRNSCAHQNVSIFLESPF